MEEEILFSVIVPIYNVEQYLIKCVDSILNQLFKDFELILVDDGSTDGCPDICDDYAREDNRVVVIHKENQGLVAARNTGVLQARGEYICYVDGDDWVKPNWLSTVYEKAVSKYKPDMIVYNATKLYENREVEVVSNVKEGIYDKNKLQNEIYPYMMYDSREPFCKGLVFHSAWNKVYKRNLLKEHYCEETMIKMGEDSAFTFECLYYADSVYFCKDSLYIYNQLNVNSMVHTYDANRFKNNIILTDYISKRLSNKNENLDMQINAFKAYWLTMAVFHEVKSKRKVSKAASHIKKEIEESKTLEGIRTDALPKSARCFMKLLELRLYRTTIVCAYIVNAFRSIKNKG